MLEEFIGLGMHEGVLCIISRSYDGKQHYYPIKIKENNSGYYPSVSDLRLYVDGEEL